MDARVRKAGKVAARVFAGLIAVVALYAAAGMIGGMIPANRHWTPPRQGVTIWVESNGVHTGIIMPKVAAGVDWRTIARPEHLRDPRYGRYDHVGFGWGERAFYLETPTWADVKASTVLAAAVGSSRTLVHVDHVPRPRASADIRAIVLRPKEYRRLAAYIAGYVVPGGAHYPGYGKYDAFYESNDRYSAVATCNAWTSRGLRTAGVRVGAWTPFPGGVLRWF